MLMDDIGDRFKEYERCWDFALPRRLPMVIRVDGRAFHSLKLEKPFDAHFFGCMKMTALALCKEVQGAVLAYFQSDEISIVARDDMQPNTNPWLGKRLSKIISLSAVTAANTFNDFFNGQPQQFDARAFVLPDLSEVTNYLIWRQQDASRNSVSMAAHAAFSHNSLHGVNTNGMLDRLREADKPWEYVATHLKRGAVVRKVTINKLVPQTGEYCNRSEWQADLEIPVFTQDRTYIETIYQSMTASSAGHGVKHAD